MIYFDNAATTYPKPNSVINSVKNSLEKYGANAGRGGYKMSMNTAERVFKTREAISTLYDCDAENVAFTLNCTNAINYVLKGCLKEGDHVLISALEHNAVARPLKSLEKKGVEVSIVPVDFNNDEVTVNNFEKGIKHNTKLIFILAASNVFGKRLPVNKIAKLAKSRNILIGIDAAQESGSGFVSFKNDHLDFLCIAPHKGLYSPMGTGILISAHSLETIIEGGTGTNSLELVQPTFLPERFESGTQNISGIIAIYEGIHFINSQGIDRINKHEFKLLQKAYNELRKIDEVILYTKEPIFGDTSPVLSFNVKDRSSEEIVMLLSEKNIAARGGLHCSPLAHREMGTLETGTVRISFSAFNKECEIDEFVCILKRIIKSQKYPLQK